MPEVPRTAYPAEITGGGIVLALTPDELYFETVEVLPEKDLSGLLTSHNLAPVAGPAGLFGASLNQAFADRRWVRIESGAAPDQVVAGLAGDDRVRLASPVYHRPDLPYKTALSFSDLVVVKLRGNAARKAIAEILDAAGTGDLAVDLEIEQADGLLVRLKLPAPKTADALDIAARLATGPEAAEARPDWMQLTPAIATTPNDPLFAQEWNLTQIAAPQGWSLSEGSANVVIAILDTGCDLAHEDLIAKYVPAAQWLDATTGSAHPADDYGHGTCCASLAAASTNNALGAAGVGWNCSIMPVKMLNSGFGFSDTATVAAINWATANGADVVSMSWTWSGPTTNIDVAIASAAEANLVLIAGSGNANGPVEYPAAHPQVMAIGGTDQLDERHGPTSPDGETWGSNFGPELSVLAPAVRLWAANNTDGEGSFNYNHGGPLNWVGVNYPSSGTADGRYFGLMSGTSAATPQVAGLAGLLLSAYPGLANLSVRDIIEQTAEKTGGYSYVNDGIHHNGTWNQEPGYGRINVFRALDYADVFIKATPPDLGLRPITGVFWDASDIVIRQNDDGIFANQPAIAGQDTYVYVRVNNAGPNTARNVSVSARAVAFLGTQFTYPGDFTAVDSLHLEPTGLVTSFATLPRRTTAIARFKLTAAQVQMIFTDAWHSCLIANVSADNDYGSGDGPNVWDNNNLGQLNFSVVASGMGGGGMGGGGMGGGGMGGSGMGARLSLPFVTGNRDDQDRYCELVIDRSALPAEAELLLNLAPSAALFPAGLGRAGGLGQERFTTTFLDRTRIAAKFCEFEGILTLEAGSQWTCAADLADELSVSGGTIIRSGGRQLVEIQAPVAVIGIPKTPGELRPMELSLRLPLAAPAGRYQVVIAQRNTAGQTVGGVTFDASVT